MSNPNDDTLSNEEQQRLYRAREAATWGEDSCVPADLILQPDVAPLEPAEKCGDDADETQTVTFVPANPAPTVPPGDNLLPAPLSVLSQEVTQECPVGQVALAGTDPTVLAAGTVGQLVYLDEIPSLAQAELFRLASYIPALQAHSSADLIAAIDTNDFTAFDLGIVTISKTSAPAATQIRVALVAAQEIADQLAQTQALAGLVCGWYNLELWVTCQSAAPGYAVTFTDPGAVEKAHVTAGVFSSAESQDDANELAARSAALELACLVTNEEQDVSCSDAGLSVDESASIVWPVSWVKAAVARDAALGTESVTLEAQGAGTWTVTDWDDFEFNTESIALGDLNGQEFTQPDLVGTSARRKLRTRVIIEAGDIRTAAPSLAEANSIARNLAVLELDCFVPNRPRVIACSTAGFGSDEAIARHAGLGLGSGNAGRATLFTEMRGGDPGVYGGPAYDRTNVGILDYGLPTETADRGGAFEVYVWPGYLAGASEASVEADAGSYGAAFLLCEWVSPAHNCLCVSTTLDTARVYVSAPGQVSSKFSFDTLIAEGALLDLPSSAESSFLNRGLITDTEYPNRAADPDYNAVTLLWPELPEICQTDLDCVFTACKTVCCEPKPDDRQYKVNGMPNYVTWDSNWLRGAANKNDQNKFLADWNDARANARFSGCPGYESGDDCAVPTIPTSGQSNSIVSQGIGDGSYGAPARFKYGGVLKWGAQWAETPPSSPNNPTNVSLPLIGTVKACHKDSNHTQTPDKWGLYHCAEGFADSSTPIGLGEIARAEALARLDCTHVNWPRHLSNCPEPSQHGFGPSVNLDIITEGNSTREANEQLEQMLLALMHCRDAHNFGLTFRGSSEGGATLEIPSPAIANIGKSECLPPGLSAAKLYEEDGTTEVDIAELPASESSHVFIIVKCVTETNEDPPDPTDKRLILKIVPDSSIDDEIRNFGRQLNGSIGLPSGLETLETLREEDPEVWYIGSFSVVDLGSGTGSWDADRVVVQVHSGPIPINESCCDSPCVQWTLRLQSSPGGGAPIAQICTGTLTGVGMSGYLGDWEPETWVDVTKNKNVWLKFEYEIEGHQLTYFSSPGNVKNVWLPSQVSSGSAELYYTALDATAPAATTPTIDPDTGQSQISGVSYFKIGSTSTSPDRVVTNDYVGPLEIGWCPPDNPRLTQLT